MLPSRFMLEATSQDVALLEDYYSAQADAEAIARRNAELCVAADKAAQDAKGQL
jgi:hypothetical protein